MVHFGSYLKSHDQSESRKAYVNYKALKKLVKVCASDRDPTTSQVGSEPASHVGSSLRTTADPPTSDEVETRDPPTSNEADTRDSESLLDASRPRTWDSFLLKIQEQVRKLNEFTVKAKCETQSREDLEELAIFAETNRVAFQKIVKKFQKKCGQWDALQLFLQHLHEEVFLTCLSEELLEARTKLKTRLSLAGVCRDTVPDDTVVHTISRHEDDSGVVEQAVDPSGVASSNRRPRVAGLIPRVRFLARRLWVSVALLCLGCLSIICGGILEVFPGAPEVAKSIVYGAGLLMIVIACIKFLVEYLGMMESGPSFKYCIWQQMRYTDINAEDGDRPFSIMKVPCKTIETLEAGIVEHGECPPSKLPGGGGNCRFAEALPTECGVCLQEFHGQSIVAVLPCYHLFCEACIVSWSSSSSKGSSQCPTCRASYKYDMQ